MNLKSNGNDEVVCQMSREEAKAMLSSLDDLLDKYDLFSWKENDGEVVSEFREIEEKLNGRN